MASLVLLLDDGDDLLGGRDLVNHCRRTVCNRYGVIVGLGKGNDEEGNEELIIEVFACRCELITKSKHLRKVNATSSASAQRSRCILRFIFILRNMTSTSSSVQIAFQRSLDVAKRITLTRMESGIVWMM